MSKGIQISVIMPIHNTGIYLEECLSSVFNQSFQAFELICLDDCSQDVKTKEILDKYQSQNSNMKVVFLEQNVGAAETRNIGYSYSQGKYVIFLDADDVFDKDMLSLLYYKIVVEDADVCICGYETFIVENDKKKVTSRRIPKPEEVQNKDDEDWFANQIYAPWNKLCRRSFLEDNRITFQNLSSSNDVFFSCMVLTGAKKISIITEALVKYRTNVTSQISFHRNPFNFFAAVDKLSQFLDKTKEINKQLFLLMLQGGLYELCLCKNDELKKQAYEVLSQICKENKEVPIKNNKQDFWRKCFVSQPYESKWFCQKLDYLNQLRLCAEEIKKWWESQKEIYLWGLGKRGTAFQKFCREENLLLSGVADKKNNAIGQRTEYNYLTIATKEVLSSSGIIIASNNAIYDELLVLLGNESRIVNLERYCP